MYLVCQVQIFVAACKSGYIHYSFSTKQLIILVISYSCVVLSPIFIAGVIGYHLPWHGDGGIAVHPQLHSFNYAVPMLSLAWSKPILMPLLKSIIVYCLSLSSLDYRLESYEYKSCSIYVYTFSHAQTNYYMIVRPRSKYCSSMASVSCITLLY